MPTKQRSVVIVIRDGAVALIRRIRDEQTYYLFPGGTVEPWETVEQAAVREAHEELGVHVTLSTLVAVVERPDSRQFHFLSHIQSGEFGTGTGEELSSSPDSERGSYVPCWLPVEDLARHDVRPHALAQAIREGKVSERQLPMILSD